MSHVGIPKMVLPAKPSVDVFLPLQTLYQHQPAIHHRLDKYREDIGSCFQLILYFVCFFPLFIP